MKNKDRIWIYPIIVVGYVIILTSCCKKDDSAPTTTTVTDIDGNAYNIVTIGTQVWMKENLKTTKYLNGDLIGSTTPVSLDITGESTPKYQWACGGNESNVSIYGRLYTWYTITDSRNLCPKGWHVPTDSEWTTLTTFLGGESIAGGKLKETGAIHWVSPNTQSTNESGFTALPGSYRDDDGIFGNIGNVGLWWSATEAGTVTAWSRGMGLGFSGVNVVRGSNDKSSGFTVRCLKD